MIDNLLQGLSISIIGLSITFSVLGIMIGVITLLNRFFPEGGDKGGKSSGEPVVQEIKIVHEDTESRDEEIAAVIAVALSFFYSQEISKSSLGNSLLQGRGAWWVSGRAGQRQLGTLGK